MVDRRYDQERQLFDAILDLHDVYPTGHGNRPYGRHAQTYPTGQWTTIEDYHPEDMVLTVGAGISITHLNEALQAHGQWLPWISTTADDDTLGGALSAGVDSWAIGGYGPLGDRVLGLRVVTPQMGPIFVGSRVVKSVSGYNLTRLFLGSRGSFGIITEVTVKVSPIPSTRATWHRHIQLNELWSQVGSLNTMASQWASIVIQPDAEHGVDMWAQWHGRAEGSDHLQATMGTPDNDPRAPFFPDAPIILMGAVPRAHIVDLLAVWPNRSLQVECQSGLFVGGVADNEQWQSLYDWVRTAQGGIRVLSSPDPLSHPVSDPLWNHFKSLYDPNHNLWNFQGG